MLTELWNDLLHDFGDQPDLAQVIRSAIRLVVAAALGAILGYDREKMGKSAGIRTHMLVSLGCALPLLFCQQAGMEMADLSRVVQGIAAGIGFIGAGAILKNNEERIVEGVTTAASIWVTAAIGMTVGIGKVGTALLATLIAWSILSVLCSSKGKPGQILKG